MNVSKVSLTVGALFALSVPAANAAVILGDGAGSGSTAARTPAAAAVAKHHTNVERVKDVPPPVPPNFYQVQKNSRWRD